MDSSRTRLSSESICYSIINVFCFILFPSSSSSSSFPNSIQKKHRKMFVICHEYMDIMRFCDAECEYEYEYGYICTLETIVDIV